MARDEHSAGHLLDHVRRGRATTRGELIRLTGLARSTVAHRVDQLLDAGLLRESAGAPEPGAGRGRPADRLAFADTRGLVVVAGLHRDRADLAVLDLGGRVLVRRDVPVLVEDGPDVVLAVVEEQLEALVAEAGSTWEPVVAVAVGVPGPVDAAGGRVMQPPVMPGWHDHPVRDRLAERFGVPVFVENDANLMALGEQRVHWPSAPALVLVKVDSGVGAGIVVEGRLFRGVDGGAGDIGHIRMHGHEERCRCGAVGCLAAVVSAGAIVRALAARGKQLDGREVATTADLRQLVQRGDPDAVAAVRTAGQHAGEVLTTVVSVLNPEILVLAGDMAHTNGHFVTGLREVVYQRSLPRATRSLRLVTTKLGDSATLLGAVELVLDAAFAPDQVDAALAGRGALIRLPRPTPAAAPR
jgi:predicted NBD/HSP70 family sugar kinase